jgi:NAD(P)-dependent dehydrogenase (short-subunit alcohol dehydrogenase family)
LTGEQIRYNVGGDECCVIGGTAGVGLAIARELCGYGADVTVMGRNAPPTLDPHMRFVSCDVRTSQGQRQCADAVRNVTELKVLVLSVQLKPHVLQRSKERADNGEGIELHLAVSCISRRRVLERLIERGLPVDCRVFVVGFHGRKWSPKRIDLTDFNAERTFKAKVQRAHVGKTVLFCVMYLYSKVYLRRNWKRCASAGDARAPSREKNMGTQSWWIRVIR